MKNKSKIIITVAFLAVVFGFSSFHFWLNGNDGSPAFSSVEAKLFSLADISGGNGAPLSASCEAVPPISHFTGDPPECTCTAASCAASPDYSACLDEGNVCGAVCDCRSKITIKNNKPSSDGTGKVTSTETGAGGVPIDCDIVHGSTAGTGAACAVTFRATSSVTLNAVPSAGSKFSKWNTPYGAQCEGINETIPSCSFTAPLYGKTIKARFDPGTTVYSYSCANPCLNSSNCGKTVSGTCVRSDGVFETTANCRNNHGITPCDDSYDCPACPTDKNWKEVAP